MTALRKPVFSAENFLDWEAEQTEKHEYIAGEVFAMAGASDVHVTISGNIFAALRNHLRGKPCRTYIADMKLFVATADAFFYPDVFVTCAPADAARPDHKREPVLIIEVLSPSTAAYDRGLKFAYYRQLPGLQEYVLIDPERMAVDVFRRNAAGEWVLYPFDAGEMVTLASVAFSLPIEEVYEDALPAPLMPPISPMPPVSPTTPIAA